MDLGDLIGEYNMFVWDYANLLYMNRPISSSNANSFLHNSLDPPVMEALKAVGGGAGMGIVEGREWEGYAERFCEERNGEREKKIGRGDIKGGLKAKYAEWLETEGMGSVSEFLREFVKSVGRRKEKEKDKDKDKEKDKYKDKDNDNDKAKKKREDGGDRGGPARPVGGCGRTGSVGGVLGGSERPPVGRGRTEDVGGVLAGGEAPALPPPAKKRREDPPPAPRHP